MSAVVRAFIQATFRSRVSRRLRLDVSRTGLALTKHLIRSLHFLRLAKAIGIEPSMADFIRGELPFFPVVDCGVQAIFVNYTLHLLTHKELAICMSEFRRILDDGGVLLVHEPCGDKLVPPDKTIEVLEDGSWFLKKYGVVNWNLTRGQLSKMMSDSFTVLDEERTEEDGKPKIVFLLKKG